MAITERVRRLLDDAQVDYEVLSHREVFTSQEVAQSVHVAGRTLAKVVVVRETSGQYLMAVIPATCHLDLGALVRETGRPGVVLAGEEDLRRLFPDCEPGAMPPFGRLYGMPMYLDHCFRKEPRLCFQAGNHHEVVRVDTEDFLGLVRPLAGELCMHPVPVHV